MYGPAGGWGCACERQQRAACAAAAEAVPVPAAAGHRPPRLLPVQLLQLRQHPHLQQRLSRLLLQAPLLPPLPPLLLSGAFQVLAPQPAVLLAVLLAALLLRWLGLVAVLSGLLLLLLSLWELSLLLLRQALVAVGLVLVPGLPLLAVQLSMPLLPLQG